MLGRELRLAMNSHVYKITIIVFVLCIYSFQAATQPKVFKAVVKSHVCLLKKRPDPSLGGLLQWSVPYDEICYCQAVVAPRSVDTCPRKDDHICSDSLSCNFLFVDDPTPFIRRQNWNKETLDELFDRSKYCVATSMTTESLADQATSAATDSALTTPIRQDVTTSRETPINQGKTTSMVIYTEQTTDKEQDPTTTGAHTTQEKTTSFETTMKTNTTLDTTTRMVLSTKQMTTDEQTTAGDMSTVKPVATSMPTESPADQATSAVTGSALTTPIRQDVTLSRETPINQDKTTSMVMYTEQTTDKEQDPTTTGAHTTQEKTTSFETTMKANTTHDATTPMVLSTKQMTTAEQTTAGDMSTVKPGCSLYARPLGVSNRSIIPDDRLSASSYKLAANYSTVIDFDCEPKYARLHTKGFWANDDATDPTPWIQVDFGITYRVTGLLTQGYAIKDTEQYWVRAINVQVVPNGRLLEYIKDNNGNTKSFIANGNAFDVAEILLDSDGILTRWVRIFPTVCVTAGYQQIRKCLLRLDVVGC